LKTILPKRWVTDPGQGIDRTYIKIHPTRMLTHGCIGIKGKEMQIKFYNVFKKLREKYKIIKLKAENINGSKIRTIKVEGQYGGEKVVELKQ
jgi:hypothetical protein